MTKDNIVKFKKRMKPEQTAEEVEAEGAAIVCPYCKGVEWAVTIDEKTACIDYLVCVSDDCDGDAYIEVENGVVGEDVFKLDVDF